jgi:F-type H+-transporting ATPase subunit b
MRTAHLFRSAAVALLALFALGVSVKPVLAEKHQTEAQAHAEAEAKARDGGHGATGHGVTEKDESGLGFTSFKRYDLGIWTLVVFGLLLLVLSKYAWPNIKAGLEKREATIRTAHEEAKQERMNAEAKLVEAKRQLDEAAAQAKAIIDEARKAADALRATEKEAGIKEAEARKQQAEREITAYKDALIKDVYSQAVKLAALMSEKALRREVSTADHSRLLEESLAELRSSSKA